MSTTYPPPAATAAIVALAMPFVRQFATEIANLPPEEQNRRIAKVLTSDAGSGLAVASEREPPLANRPWPNLPQ